MSTISVTARLDELLGRTEKASSSSWVGDAIYGVNDGLGAIFGIIAGVAGFTPNNHTLLISGFFGALASTLSMGAGAWLASKSENELMETGLKKVHEDIQNHREKELQILCLIYQEKGFSEKDAYQIAQTIATDEARFQRTMAQEKLGIHELNKGNPWSSALFGALSTFIGAIIPLLPFFFMHGIFALIAAAIVSLLAHFLVGAAKSLVVNRSWWSSGLEMTLVGILVGIVSYTLGVIGSQVLSW